MYCENCGTQMKPDTDVCPGCGSINRNEKYDTAEMPKLSSNNANNSYQNIPNVQGGTYLNNGYNPYNNTANMYGGAPYGGGETVSVLRWIGRMLISWIPFVGGIINLIMLIVWACSDRFERTSKNWAIARIVIILVQILISVIFGIFLYTLILELLSDPTFQRDLQMFFSSI